MARFARLLGNRDVQLTELNRIAGAAAGTGTDYEIGSLLVTDLTKTTPLTSGESGALPPNDLYLRAVEICTEATLTGAATNNFIWQVRQWRAGAILNQYSLASASSISVGANTIAVTQGSLTNVLQNVRVGDMVYISGGTGTAEYVQITALSVANGTITFTAANTHSGAYSMVCTALASVWYNGAGVTEAAYTIHQLNCIPHYLKPGDVVTFQRLSFGTGLASPAVAVQLDYVSVSGTPTGPIPRG